MGNSDDDQDASADKSTGKTSDADNENSLDYLLDKPPSTREYFKLLFYFVMVVLAGVLIAVLVFLANK